MRKKLFTLFAFLPLAGLPVCGSAAGADSAVSLEVPAKTDAAARLEAFARKTPAAQGTFAQTNFDREGKVLLKASGDFAFARPGRFDWLYTEPYRQRIVSDGETLWLYDEDLLQVTEKKLKGAVDATPAAILFGENDLEKDWRVSSGAPVDGLERTVAVPKVPGTFAKVEILWGKSDFPERMILTDAFGQKTELIFTSLGRDAPEAARFRFEVPEGVDLLRDGAF